MDKAHLFLACLLLTCAVGWAAGQDYEDDRAPPVSRARPPRGPIIPSRAGKQSVQKTSTTEAPPLEEEVEYEDELIEEEPTTTTTTEAPRKGIRGGVVRPFRSNNDLIEALKRRRAQAQNGAGVTHSSQQGSSTTTQSSVEPTQRQGRKSKSSKFSRGSAGSSTTEQPLEEQPAPRSRAQFPRGRRF